MSAVSFDTFTEETGRYAGQPREFIRIVVSPDNVIHRAATEEDKKQYPDEYAEFKRASPTKAEVQAAGEPPPEFMAGFVAPEEVAVEDTHYRKHKKG